MRGIRVLLVDDEDDFRIAVAKRLGKRGAEVVAVASGREALESASERPVDVVVLDVKMPGMDGLETLRELKRTNPLVEVIMLTGLAAVDSGVEVMSRGAFDYLVKPCDIDDLVARIEDAYQRRLARGGAAL